MFRNHFKITLRQIERNKLYSFINIVGLAIGTTCFLLMALYVQTELSYDKHFKDSDKVYQVYLNNGEAGKSMYTTVAPLANLIEESIPAVDATVRFGKWENRVLKVNEEKFLYKNLYYTDKSFFETFDLPFLGNTPDNVRFGTNDIVLSESEAIKLFGNVESAYEKVVEVVDLGDFQVTGVFEDLPKNTHMDFSFLISFTNMEDILKLSMPTAIGGVETQVDLNSYNAFPLYLKLESQSDLTNLEESISGLIASNFDSKSSVELVALEDIYFADVNPAYFGKKGDIRQFELYVLIGVIILIVAIVNYANLTTSRYGKRAKEVGVRKTMGSFRSQLISQLISESVFLTFLAVILSVCLLEMVAPWFASFSGTMVSLDFSNVFTYFFLLGFIFLIGLISGIYPAFYLSKTGAVEMLSGSTTKGKKGSIVRQVLVSFQFLTCLSLMIITGIVFTQFKHLSTIDKGFDAEQVISFHIKDKGIQSNFSALKTAIQKIPSVQYVNGSTFSIFDNGSPVMVLNKKDSEEKIMATMVLTEAAFIENFNIELIQGQGFDIENTLGNSGKLLVNETLVKQFGWTDPLNESLMGMKVIGVVKDFIYGSAKHAITPLFIMSEQAGFSQLYVKLNTTDLSESIQQIESAYNQLAVTYPFEYEFLDDQFAEKYRREESLSRVFTLFSILAVFIAGLGMFGLSLFIVEQRTKEIGIRKVLGASITNIVWLLNTNITKLLIGTSLVAVPLSFYFMRNWLDGFTNQIELNLWLFGLPIVAMLLLIWSILIYHTLKIARANPVRTLRTE